METEGLPVGARVHRRIDEWRPKGSLWELGFPERMETEGLLAACANASNTAGRPSASIRPAEPASHKTRSGAIRPAEPASHKVQSAARRPAEPPHLLWEPDLSGEWRRRHPGGSPSSATTAGRPSASIRPAEPGSHKTRSGPIRPAEPGSHKTRSGPIRPAEPASHKARPGLPHIQVSSSS